MHVAPCERALLIYMYLVQHEGKQDLSHRLVCTLGPEAIPFHEENTPCTQRSVGSTGARITSCPSRVSQISNLLESSLLGLVRKCHVGKCFSLYCGF